MEEQRVLASGSVALVYDGKTYWIGDAEEAYEAYYYYHPKHGEAYAIYCSLCDGAGHGQPGYGPCPLENAADYSNEPWWAL
jgi:hypothetical protein